MATVDPWIVFGTVQELRLEAGEVTRRSYLPVLVNISLSNLSAGRRSENLGSSPSK
jgi:hypothetical protein